MNLFLPDNSSEAQRAEKDLEDSIFKPVAPPGYKEGPHPVISEPLFSLVIFIYISVIFLYMFFAFCWSDLTPTNTFSPKRKPKPVKTVKRFVYPSPGTNKPFATNIEVIKKMLKGVGSQKKIT